MELLAVISKSHAKRGLATSSTSQHRRWRPGWEHTKFMLSISCCWRCRSEAQQPCTLTAQPTPSGWQNTAQHSTALPQCSHHMLSTMWPNYSPLPMAGWSRGPQAAVYCSDPCGCTEPSTPKHTLLIFSAALPHPVGKTSCCKADTYAKSFVRPDSCQQQGAAAPLQNLNIIHSTRLSGCPLVLKTAATSAQQTHLPDM